MTVRLEWSRRPHADLSVPIRRLFEEYDLFQDNACGFVPAGMAVVLAAPPQARITVRQEYL